MKGTYDSMENQDFSDEMPFLMDEVSKWRDEIDLENFYC